MGWINVQGLCKEYVERRRETRVVGDRDAVPQGERLRVLDGLDLDISNGELVCILGPSGCGKSTLLRIIAGFEEPSSGKVTIDGSAVNGPGRNSVFVFQHSGLLPWLTVEQNARLGLRNCGDRREVASRVEEAIELVDLQGFEGHFPHQLSGGMQRRAELARALVVDPGIFFMDEPFSGLDFLTRLKLREEIINMHELLKRTILFITHDIDEALIMGDRLVVLSSPPATVLLDLVLSFPHPRDFSRSPELAQLRRTVYRTLDVHDAL